MLGFIEGLFVYLIIGLIAAAYVDEEGDTRKMMAVLLGRCIKWPVTLYRIYIKETTL